MPTLLWHLSPLFFAYINSLVALRAACLNTRYIQPSNLPFFWQQKDPMNIQTQRDIFCMPVFHSLPRIRRGRKMTQHYIGIKEIIWKKTFPTYLVEKPETEVELNKVLLYFFSVISWGRGLIQKRFYWVSLSKSI